MYQVCFLFIFNSFKLFTVFLDPVFYDLLNIYISIFSSNGSYLKLVSVSQLRCKFGGFPNKWKLLECSNLYVFFLSSIIISSHRRICNSPFCWLQRYQEKYFMGFLWGCVISFAVQQSTPQFNTFKQQPLLLLTQVYQSVRQFLGSELGSANFYWTHSWHL